MRGAIGRSRWVLRLVAIAGVAGVACLSAARVAVATGTNSGRDQLVLRYRMIPRLVRGADGMIEYPAAYRGHRFPVAVSVSESGDRPCDPTGRYRFYVDGSPTPARPTARPCEWSVGMAQGQHRLEVRAILTHARERGYRTVEVRNFLIVGLGDSVASGEGNPDIPGTTTDGPQWEYAPCDRSANSFEARAAEEIERAAHLRASVTFLHLACAGAGMVTGVAGPYFGIKAGGLDLPLDSQISQMHQEIGSREPDAVIISIGADDIYFGSIFEFCTYHPTCYDDTVMNHETLEAWVDHNLSALPQLYEDLAEQLNAVGVPASRVYMTQYYDPTRGATGSTCHRIIHRFGVRDARWTYNEILRPLNSQIAAATHRWGWHLIAGAQQGFRNHGYCSSSPWIVSLGQSLSRQHDRNGTLHPNDRGQAFIARLAFRALRPDLLPGGKPGL